MRSPSHCRRPLESNCPHLLLTHRKSALAHCVALPLRTAVVPFTDAVLRIRVHGRDIQVESNHPQIKIIHFELL